MTPGQHIHIGLSKYLIVVLYKKLGQQMAHFEELQLLRLFCKQVVFLSEPLQYIYVYIYMITL